MSRISRILITTLFLAGAVAACESKKDETSREAPVESTMPAQTTRSETTPPPTTPTTPAEPGAPSGMMPGAPSGTMPGEPGMMPGGTATTPTTPTTPGAAPAAGHDMSAMGDMSDAQIASVVSMVNKAEIDTAKLALSKTQNADVKRFAEMMNKDHSAAEDKAKTLLQKLGVSPQEGDLTRQMTTELSATSDRMQGLSGDAFDKAYIADQVQAHQKALDHLDKSLISSADNPELKSHLEAFRKTIASHLEEAKKIHANLK